MRGGGGGNQQCAGAEGRSAAKAQPDAEVRTLMESGAYFCQFSQTGRAQRYTLQVLPLHQAAKTSASCEPWNTRQKEWKSESQLFPTKKQELRIEPHVPIFDNAKREPGSKLARHRNIEQNLKYKYISPKMLSTLKQKKAAASVPDT